jgi:colicin import membrane protein
VSRQATRSRAQRQSRKQRLREELQAFGLALAVHAVAGGLLWLGSLTWQPERPEIVPSFTLVDAAPLVEMQRNEAIAEQQAEAAERRLEQAQQEEAERRRELEQQQQLEQEQAERQALLERQRREQLEREAEQARQAELQRELERQRREAEQARLDELRELRRRREEAQREREAQERRLAELAEQREREEQQRRAAEEAERLRLAREQAAAEERRGSLREEYVATIRELVRRNWLRPPTTRPGVECRVRVVQIPSGVIIDQAIASPCNADTATRESILSAVQRTEQLPYEGYQEVFEREIVFNFRYDGD